MLSLLQISVLVYTQTLTYLLTLTNVCLNLAQGEYCLYSLNLYFLSFDFRLLFLRALMLVLYVE